MEVLLKDIYIGPSMRIYHDKIRLLSSKQLKEFLTFKINDDVSFYICKFIQSNFNKNEMKKFIITFLKENLNDWLNIKETFIYNQFNILKKTKNK